MPYAITIIVLPGEMKRRRVVAPEVLGIPYNRGSDSEECHCFGYFGQKR